MNHFLPFEKAVRLAGYLRGLDRVAYDFEKHRMLISNEKGEETISFRLPISYHSPDFPEKEVHYIMVLIQSGSSSLGYFEDGNNLDHKVFKSYMVRMKQGKSQIKYLKTKGKSRAGSRVRLGNTMEFFENINERLQEYFNNHEIDRIAISCSKILIPYLYNSKVACPFDKKDPRIYKIPKHVDTPDYEEMLSVNRFLQGGELIFEEEHKVLVEEWLRKGDEEFGV